MFTKEEVASSSQQMMPKKRPHPRESVGDRKIQEKWALRNGWVKVGIVNRVGDEKTRGSEASDDG